MKLGIRLPYHCESVTGADLARVATAAEEAGMHSGWVADHLVFPAGRMTSRSTTTKDGRYPRPLDETTLESWTTLAYAAAVTTRLKLGVGVCVLPYRNPLVLAKVVATLDVLSGGRVLCGVGLGWIKEEFDALGAPYHTRRAYSEESIELLRRCWESSPVEYHGQHIRVEDPVHFVPRPAAQVPIIVGGHSAPALRRAARIGDGWIGHELMPDEVAEVRSRLTGMAEDGLRPGFQVVVSRLMNPRGIEGGDPAKLDTDSTTELADVLARYEEAGTDVLLCEPTVRTVDALLRLIERVHEAGDRNSMLVA